MKGIIIDIDKLTDSKELYSQKPKRIMFGFIYIIVFLVVCALVYSFFGRIEIVSKGAGIIRPNDQVSTVSGLVGGQIEEVMFMDGTPVNEGDILLVLDYTDLQTDLKQLEESKSQAEAELEFTQRYIKSLQQEQNLFSSNPDNEEEYPWYIKYEYFDATARDKSISYAYEEEQALAQKLWLNNAISTAQNEIHGLNKLKQSIETDSNQVGEDSKYAYQYRMYQATMDGLESEKASEYAALDQDASTDTRELSIGFYQARIDGYKKLLDCIEKGNNLFSDSNGMYSLMYEEYAYLLEDAKQAHQNAVLQLDMLRAGQPEGYDLALAEQDVASKEKAIEAHKNKTIQEIKSSLEEAEQQKQSLETQQGAAADKSEAKQRIDELYGQSAEEKRLSLLQQIEEALQLARNEQQGSQAELEQLESSISRLDKLGEGEDILPVKHLRLQELQISLDNKKAAEQKLLDLEYNIRKTQLDIEAATIRASRSGVINTLADVSRGDVLQAGTMVATIIPPEEQQFKVQIYMDDKSIAGIKPGDTVKYSVGALPRTQYGTPTGTVISISKDTKMQGDAQQPYYLVEATIDNEQLVDKDGNEGEISVGMTVEAQVVTSKKRLLFYILEKINILQS